MMYYDVFCYVFITSACNWMAYVFTSRSMYLSRKYDRKSLPLCNRRVPTLVFTKLIAKIADWLLLNDGPYLLRFGTQHYSKDEEPITILLHSFTKMK